MIRTQISLSKEEYRLAKVEAKRLGVSLAEFFRRSLRAALPVSKAQPWMKFCGICDSQDPSASTSIDEVIYGEDHET